MIDRIKQAFVDWRTDAALAAATSGKARGYAESLRRMLIDLQLAPHELAALQAQQRSLGLKPSDVDQLHRGALEHCVRTVLADGVLSEHELRCLEHVATSLRVPFTSLSPKALSDLQRAHVFLGITQGRLPVLPPQASHLLLKQGEVVHAAVQAQVLDERVIRREYVGGSSGFSIRIARGVSYRVGSVRGHSIPVTAVVPVDKGVLSITSHRVAFVGARKSFSSEWSKVLSVEPLLDGVHLALTGRAKSATLQYIGADGDLMAALFSHFLQHAY